MPSFVAAPDGGFYSIEYRSGEESALLEIKRELGGMFHGSSVAYSGVQVVNALRLTGLGPAAIISLIQRDALPTSPMTIPIVGAGGGGITAEQARAPITPTTPPSSSGGSAPPGWAWDWGGGVREGMGRWISPTGSVFWSKPEDTPWMAPPPDTAYKASTRFDPQNAPSNILGKAALTTPAVFAESKDKTVKQQASAAAMRSELTQPVEISNGALFVVGFLALLGFFLHRWVN